ncbi:MAG: ParB/RepB/Spo0J family partition protein [Tepidisphaeraceae bacterium]
MSNAQKPKSRLGRGLSSLIALSEIPVQAEVTAPPTDGSQAAPDAESPSAPQISPRLAAALAKPAAGPGTSPAEISIEQIVPNPHQPRRQFHAPALAELAASLKSNGLIQPIIVRRVADGYQLVAGERRLRAAKIAGMSAIPAIVREVDSFAQAQMALVENIHREDLNPMERASAYRALVEQIGLTQAELANRLGEDRSTVANYLRLLELAEPVKGMIRDGRLSLGHAKVLAGVADVLEQERLANLVVSQGLSVRNVERLIQSAVTVTPRKPTTDPSAHMQELEKSFARQLGMRVQIRTGASKSRGRVVIHYASLDQFDQLVEKLGVSSET